MRFIVISLSSLAALLLSVACQTAKPVPVVAISILVPPSVDARTAKTSKEIGWASANHFDVVLSLEASSGTSAAPVKFVIDRVNLSITGGGSWFRDRFNFVLTAHGSMEGGAERIFTVNRFVSYPGEFMFQPQQPKAREWLQKQVDSLWLELISAI